MKRSKAWSMFIQKDRDGMFSLIMGDRFAPMLDSGEALHEIAKVIMCGNMGHAFPLEHASRAMFEYTKGGRSKSEMEDEIDNLKEEVAKLSIQKDEILQAMRSRDMAEATPTADAWIKTLYEMRTRQGKDENEDPIMKEMREAKDRPDLIM